MPTSPPDKDFWTTDQLAAHLNISSRTLSRWNAKRIGPARTKIGNFICYRIATVEAWLQKNEFNPLVNG